MKSPFSFYVATALAALAGPAAASAQSDTLIPLPDVLVPDILLASPEPPAPPAPPVPAVPDTLRLDQALRYALDNNFAIQQTRERIREQEGVILEVRAQILPSVSLDASHLRYQDNAPENQLEATTVVGLNASQLLYRGGGASAGIEAAKSLREAVALELQAEISRALLDVRIRFAAVLLNRERIRVQEQNVALLGEQLQTVRNRFSAGSVSQFEVLRAEVALANAQPALIRARNEVRLAIDELRLALGYRDPQASGELTAKVPEFVGELTQEPASYELDGALAAARARRPELRALGARVGARRSGVQASKSGYLPSLYAVAGYGYNDTRLRGGFADGDYTGWSAGVQGSWAVFDGRRTAGQVRQARSQLRQTEYSLEEQTLAIEVEVRRSLNALQEAAELATAAAKVVEQAEEALRLADVRYASGAATQLDVLETRVALTEARLNRLEANFRHTVALAQVRQAIAEGDGFTVE
jgi:outer membrane protein